MAKGIRSLLDTVMQALPQVGNLGLLFFLLFFIFAALGVELFGRLGMNSIFTIFIITTMITRMWWRPPVPWPRGARPLQIIRNGLPHSVQNRHRRQLERNYEGHSAWGVWWLRGVELNKESGEFFTQYYFIQECLQNCCITTFVASLFFVVFVLVAQVITPLKTEEEIHTKYSFYSLSLLMWLWQSWWNI